MPVIPVAAPEQNLAANSATPYDIENAGLEHRPAQRFGQAVAQLGNALDEANYRLSQERVKANVEVALGKLHTSHLNIKADEDRKALEPDDLDGNKSRIKIKDRVVGATHEIAEGMTDEKAKKAFLAASAHSIKAYENEYYTQVAEKIKEASVFAKDEAIASHVSLAIKDPGNLKTHASNFEKFVIESKVINDSDKSAILRHGFQSMVAGIIKDKTVNSVVSGVEPDFPGARQLLKDSNYLFEDKQRDELRELVFEMPWKYHTQIQQMETIRLQNEARSLKKKQDAAYADVTDQIIRADGNPALITAIHAEANSKYVQNGLMDPDKLKSVITMGDTVQNIQDDGVKSSIIGEFVAGKLTYKEATDKALSLVGDKKNLRGQLISRGTLSTGGHRDLVLDLDRLIQNPRFTQVKQRMMTTTQKFINAAFDPTIHDYLRKFTPSQIHMKRERAQMAFLRMAGKNMDGDFEAMAETILKKEGVVMASKFLARGVPISLDVSTPEGAAEADKLIRKRHAKDSTTISGDKNKAKKLKKELDDDLLNLKKSGGAGTFKKELKSLKDEEGKGK